MVTGVQEPRIKVMPEGTDHPKWDEVVDFVDALGVKLDPWQWMCLRASLLRAGSVWAAFALAVCAPRQNGKNSFLEVLELVGPVVLGERLLIHTAHLADTAKESFRRLDDLIDANEWLSKDVKHIWRTNGMETIEFKGGRRIRFRTRTKGGGRGYAGCDRAIFDEAMFLPETSMGSILPVISAAPDPQIVYTGSAVDQAIMDDGMVFSRVRQRALTGKTDRLAYFEWSLDAETPELIEEGQAVNEESWAQTNPAYGVRIMPDYIKEEVVNMDLRTFAVERLGVGDWPDPFIKQTVIDLAKWAALVDTKSTLTDPVFAFDVRPDRSSTSIGVAGPRGDGLSHVEVVDKRKGTSWVVGRLAQLTQKHGGAVVCDGYGASGSLVPELEEAGVPVEAKTSRELADACGFFFDAVEDGSIRHLGQSEMVSAIKVAAQRELGDAWAWSRKNSTGDISPLVACTLALWGSHVGASPFVLT